MQIGSKRSERLEVYNPFNETLYFKLFIGRSTHESLDELNRINDRRGTETARMEHELSEEEKNEDAFAEESGGSESGASRTSQYERLEAGLPDMQKYCTELRGSDPASAKQLEDGPPVWASTAGRPEADGDPEVPVEDLVLQLASNLTELRITKESDLVKLCERLQTIAFLMPDEYFDTSTWSQINNYFKQRHLEDLEFEASASFQKLSAQQNSAQNQRQNATSPGYVDPLLARLQQQFQSIHPDALKLAEQVDTDIAADIRACSRQAPLTWEDPHTHQYLNLQLAFPSLLSIGWAKTARRYLSLAYLLYPAQVTRLWLRDMLATESWAQTGSKVAASILTNTFESFTNHVGRRHRGHSASHYLSKDFQEKKGRSKNVHPAAALTRQFELLNPQLHDQLLANNGTVGVEQSTQNFYINPIYQGVTFKVEPRSSMGLDNAVIMEPRTLASPGKKMQMTLYVKTDKSVLQTVELEGWSSSAVLDVEDITKAIRLPQDQYKFEATQISNYTKACRHPQRRSSAEHPCLDEDGVYELVKSQTLG